MRTIAISITTPYALTKVEEHKQWMKDNNIYETWMLPLERFKQRKAIVHHPVGNLPERIPLDFALFRDPNMFVDNHVSVTLPEIDVPKFSTSTVKQGVFAYLLLL